MEIESLDGNKGNRYLTSLRLLERQVNTIHRQRHELSKHDYVTICFRDKMM
jgi:hypothetical protein